MKMNSGPCAFVICSGHSGYLKVPQLNGKDLPSVLLSLPLSATAELSSTAAQVRLFNGRNKTRRRQEIHLGGMPK